MAKYARLSINLGKEPAKALREEMNAQGITATEAIRRAISVWKFFQDERRSGSTFYVRRPDEKDHREVVIMDQS